MSKFTIHPGERVINRTTSVAERHVCPVCKESHSGREGEACYTCTMLALRGYGWTQGTMTPQGLRRGPGDRGSLDELQRRSERGKVKP